MSLMIVTSSEAFSPAAATRGSPLAAAHGDAAMGSGPPERRTMVVSGPNVLPLEPISCWTTFGM